MLLSVKEFDGLCREIFRKHGFTDEEVDVTTEEIVDAQLRGRSSHGAAIVPEIVEWKAEKAGSIDIVVESPISAYINGNNNIGTIVSKRAMDIAINKAEKSKIGIVGVNNKFPFITAGFNPRRAALRGLIGANLSVAASKVAPWGSADPILGTNPLGVAVPSNNGPIVLDMATTEIAAAEIRRCQKLGLSIPDGVAISKDGHLTTDPQDAIDGAMLPFGRYKGSGLAVLIELLGGPFVGAKAGKSVSGNRGFVFIALQCDLFVSREKFLADVSSFITEVNHSRIRQGFNKVLLPGQRSDQLLAKAQQDGINIEDSIYQTLKTLSERHADSK